MRTGNTGIAPASPPTSPQQGEVGGGKKETEPYLTIGVIGSVVGLRGEVRCDLLTDFPERFASLQEVIVKTKMGERCSLGVKRVRYGKSSVYITFKEVTSREQAFALKDGVIQIPEEDRTPLPPDHYYRYDIEGLDVYLEAGTPLGKIVSIIETGSNDVYVVQQGDREYLIPAMKSVVKKIDLSKREMTICPMDGLLDG